MDSQKRSDWEICWRLLRFSRPYWLNIVGMFLLSLLAAPLALLAPLPLKIGVDSLVSGRPLPAWFRQLFLLGPQPTPGAMLLAVASLVILIALVSQVQQVISALLSTYTSQRLIISFRTMLFRATQRLSLAYHDTRGTADSTSRIVTDSSAIEGISLGLFPVVTSLITMGAMVVVTMRLDWQLALVGLTVAPLMGLGSNYYRRKLRGQWLEMRECETAAQAVIQEALGAIRVVKAFGREDHEEWRFVKQSERGQKTRLRVARNQSTYEVFINLITAAGTAAVLWMGLAHVQSGALTLGNLLLVMAYLAQLYEPVRSIGKQGANLQKYLASADRALFLLEEPQDVPEAPNARRLVRANGQISFQNVSFGYDKDRMVLEDFSIEVGAGSRVGIAGRTGAGKSTVLSLLTRFYDPTAGHILLDGIDIKDYKIADLRDQFAIVLQDPVLFSTTIGDNIAYASPDASQERIIAAAKAANAHEFISMLPNGYDTKVGERGIMLSGGERQRISLARAFLKDAPILLLDEPTSSVDVKTEAAIMEAMERLMAGRTCIMIAHRLSTLDKCDVRLEIHRGRLEQDAGLALVIGNT